MFNYLSNSQVSDSWSCKLTKRNKGLTANMLLAQLLFIFKRLLTQFSAIWVTSGGNLAPLSCRSATLNQIYMEPFPGDTPPLEGTGILFLPWFQEPLSLPCGGPPPKFFLTKHVSCCLSSKLLTYRDISFLIKPLGKSFRASMWFSCSFTKSCLYVSSPCLLVISRVQAYFTPP